MQQVSWAASKNSLHIGRYDKRSHTYVSCKTESAVGGGLLNADVLIHAEQKALNFFGPPIVPNPRKMAIFEANTIHPSEANALIQKPRTQTSEAPTVIKLSNALDCYFLRLFCHENLSCNYCFQPDKQKNMAMKHCHTKTNETAAGFPRARRINPECTMGRATVAN